MAESQPRVQDPAQPAPAKRLTPAVPPVSQGLELQSEDYALARSRFHTNLVRKGPSPQRYPAIQLAADAEQIEYVSSGLHLKAWVSRAISGSKKRPGALFLHGGWAFGDDDWEQCQPLRAGGFAVLTPMLRGENGQPGTFSMYYDEVDDALAAAEVLAERPDVDPDHLYIAGHSAGGTLTLLTAMAPRRFKAAASLSGSCDRIVFVRSGFDKVTPFDLQDVREFQMRSPVAYATSFKCPTRLFYGSQERVFDAESRRTAILAREKGLDVEAIAIPGDHMSSVPAGLSKAIEFFQKHE